MRKAEVVSLFDYMYWANHRVLDAADALPPGQFLAPTTVTTRDLRATLVHELDVEWSWRLNLQGRLADDEAELLPEDFPHVAVLRERWRRDEAEMRTWLDTLTDEQLTSVVSTGPLANSLPLWQFLVHILMHAAQQQADAATLLTMAHHSPGELGYLEFLRSG